jgi:uncharacterized protein (TIGR03437 family)
MNQSWKLLCNVLPWASAVALMPLPSSAQSVQQRDVMIAGNLTSGFDMGVNTSGGRTDWVSPDNGSLKMAGPPGQDWSAVFVTWGPSVSQSRPGTDMSAYATLVVEIRGDPGKTLQIGIKDKDQADDGNETKVTVLLTSNWRSYAIPLSRFTKAGVNKLYVVAEFVWPAQSPTTAWVRNIRFTSVLAPSIDGVVNAASFQAGVVAGAWNSIVGANLSSTSRSWADRDFQGATLPVALDGISVNIGERDMAVYYISPGQINTLIFGDVPAGPNYVTVTTALGASVPLPVTVLAIFPAVFTIDPNNKYAAAVHLDGTLVGRPGLFGTNAITRPAAPGETIQIYGTGFGPTNPPLTQDQLIQAAVPLADAANWQAQIGAASAPIGFAGLTGSGLNQFNVTIPNVADGDQPLVLANGLITTRSGVFVTVQK